MIKRVLLIFFPSVTIWGNIPVSNEKLWESIDLMSNRINGLEKRVKSLENQNHELKKEISQSQQVTPSKLTNIDQILPSDPDQKKSFLDKLRFEIKSNADKSSGPWVNPQNWEKIRRKMSQYEVRKVLGTPTKIKPSNKPNIEQIYFYIGDLNADGTPEEGIVNFSDKRVVSFQSPFG